MTPWSFSPQTDIFLLPKIRVGESLQPLNLSSGLLLFLVRHLSQADTKGPHARGSGARGGEESSEGHREVPVSEPRGVSPGSPKAKHVAGL